MLHCLLPSSSSWARLRSLVCSTISAVSSISLMSLFLYRLVATCTLWIQAWYFLFYFMSCGCSSCSWLLYLKAVSISGWMLILAYAQNFSTTYISPSVGDEIHRDSGLCLISAMGFWYQCCYQRLRWPGWYYQCFLPFVLNNLEGRILLLPVCIINYRRSTQQRWHDPLPILLTHSHTCWRILLYLHTHCCYSFCVRYLLGTWLNARLSGNSSMYKETAFKFVRFGLYKITSFVVFWQGALPTCSKYYLSPPMLHKSSEQCQDRPTYW